MQITIVQVEIEEAIINHVKSQVTVRDDQDITVDLKATRGNDGYQAVIDIRPKKAGTNAEETPVLESAPMKPLNIEKAVEESKTDKPKSAAKAVVEPVLKAEVPATPVAEPEVTAAVEPEATPVAAARTPLFTPKAAAPAVAEAIGGATDAPTPAAPSIFGSLKKPVNN